MNANLPRGRDGHADVLLVIPPFGGIDRPALGAHLLQACARQSGFDVDVYYANLDFAARIGESIYETIAYAPSTLLLGERIFARAAFGVPPLGRCSSTALDTIAAACEVAGESIDAMRAVERVTDAWIDGTAQAIAQAGYRIVGCSTTFEQTAASAALLAAIKAVAPHTITLLGGANCDGPMTEGMLGLDLAADFVFRGESESAFTGFLQQWRYGTLPMDRVVAGEPCRDLDALPAPDFAQFFEQCDALAPALDDRYGHWLVYESSRGCWWGAKQHCSFCGLNADQMSPRTKSAERVMVDLAALRERHGDHPVCLTDNIMPHEYFRTLLPRLQQRVPGVELFYESKANLSLAQVRALVESGVHCIQPGIESLSTRLLTIMRKGVTAHQNLKLLRYARACGLELRWNLLHDIPGDSTEDYEALLALMPLLVHLEPAQGLFAVTIDRFSPYHATPERFGIRNVRPVHGYADVFPAGAPLMDLAYHFDGDFESGSRHDRALIQRVRDQLAHWRSRWRGASRPLLAVVVLGDGDHALIDSRDLGACSPYQPLTSRQAAAVLDALPLRRAGADHAWARLNRLAVEIDGWHVGLATAEPATFEAFERRARRETTVRSVPQ